MAGDPPADGSGTDRKGAKAKRPARTLPRLMRWTGRTARKAAATAAVAAVDRFWERRAEHVARRAAAIQARTARAPVRRGPLGRAYAVLKTAVLNFIADDALSLAAMLAFTLVLAFFPFLIFLAAVAALFGGTELAQHAADLMVTVLPEDVAGVLAPEVHRVLNEQAGGLITFGIIVTLGSLTGAIESIREGLNRAYGVKDQRSIVRKRYQGLIFVFIGSGTLVLVALLTVVAPVGFDMLAHATTVVSDWRPILSVVRVLALVLVLGTTLAALHLWLPCHRIGLRRVWIGVAATIVLWYVAGWGFTLYLRAFGGYARTYAGLAGIVAALMFFYIASAILLLGGEINRAILDTRES
jgi:membrane protein